MKKVDEEILTISKFLWEQEKESMKKNLKRDFTELIEILDPLIESGKVLYPDYIETFTDFFEKNIPKDEEDSKEERTKAIDKTIAETIEFYKNLN